MINRYIFARIFFGLLFLLTFIFWDKVYIAVLPLAFGLMLSFVLLPLQNFLEQRNIKQSVAAFICVGGFFSVFVMIMYFTFVPILVSFLNFIEQLPQYLRAINYRTGIGHVLLSMGIEIDFSVLIGDSIMSFITKAGGLELIFDGMVAIVIFLMTSFYTFFFLRDGKKFFGCADYFIQEKNRSNFKYICNEIVVGFNTYLYGHLFIALICGLLSLIVFTALQLDGWPFLCIFMMIMAFIPFIGPIIGGIPAILVSIPMGNNFLYVFFSVILIQLITFTILSPKTLGNSLDIHPVFAIISVFIASSFLGILGLIFSIPVLIIIKVLGKNWYLSQVRK